MVDNEKNMALLIKWCNEKCEGCREHCDSCSANAVKQLLVYAHDQKAEIERLQSMNQAKLDTIHDLMAEVERLDKARQKQAQFLGEERGQKYELINKITKAKSEAIKEFWEKLKKKTKTKYITYKEISYSINYVEIKDGDNLVKKMESENNV